MIFKLQMYMLLIVHVIGGTNASDIVVNLYVLG